MHSLNIQTKKQWGWTTLEATNDLCEVHRVDILRNGFCSWHHHENKVNIFSVAKGRLLIQWGDINEPEEVLLQPGDTFTVPAGIDHRFAAPYEPVSAFEVYYPAHERGTGFVAISQTDIVRAFPGGTNWRH